ncbi:MAG: restriction endonuclease subunit M, partial [Candidatus Buchananbacteria bacterium]|nr:restriction endonuclease subunit M [Candidatus Buchananbacteria bacterium]
MDKKKIILNTPNLELEQAKLKKKLQELVNKFKAQDGWSKREQDIQTSFTIELLKILGWDSSNWVLDTAQDVKTGKNPDIILKSDSGSKLLVIESKDASSKDKLDGSYGNKKFTQQLFDYCHGEGLSWGVLTNFIEWRLYSVHHGRLYKERKYAFHDLLWDNADKKYYIDLLSDEGLNFLSQLSKSELTRKNGIIDSDPIYYPEQLDLEQDKIKKDFFNKIKNWRAKLRAFIIKNYPKYDAEIMSQKIIDRLIFIDLCHDRKILSQNYLDSVLQSKQLKYEELKSVFRAMDEKFNTELFAPNDADELKISDEIIIKIIKELDEIDFSKLSVHIIGEVYENYLGELLRSNARKEETIKQKQKSKRKSQGIYYTPAYIVDYIVK